MADVTLVVATYELRRPAPCLSASFERGLPLSRRRYYVNAHPRICNEYCADVEWALRARCLPPSAGRKLGLADVFSNSEFTCVFIPPQVTVSWHSSIKLQNQCTGSHGREAVYSCNVFLAFVKPMI